MVLPIIFIGTISTLYYRDIIRQNIWEENLGQAKTISSFTLHYVDSALLYIQSQAARPSIYQAVEQGNIEYLNNNILYIQNSSIFYNIYVTDSNGTIIASYPYDIVGRDDLDKPWVNAVLKSRQGYVSESVISNVSNKPTVYICAPIMQNDTLAGVMIGSLDLHYYTDFILSPDTASSKYTYIVNRTGHVMVHTNKSYMDTMQNISGYTGVQNVLRGEEGITEQFSTVENADKLASYSPIHKYGWGVVVSLPSEVAYDPINRATQWFALVTSLLAIIAIAIAGLSSKYIVDPLLLMTRATRSMPYGDYRKDLALPRQDEIGDLARSFDHMAGDIRDSQQKIVAARDRAEEEKNRAELYVDIMGHDINNLNQTALANLEIIESDPELPEDLREYILSAITSVKGSAGIIDNVRKIQQITGEELHLEKEDIHDLITRCIEESPKPQGKKVTINYTGRPGMIINGTPLLKEVFCNIIGNSIKYSGPEVTITIDTREILDTGKKIYEIAIADNGHGIPDEVKGRLFRRFERGTTKAHGKGLGLYIVKMLVERFGGTVGIEDRVPGDYAKGAKFIVRLPAA